MSRKKIIESVIKSLWIMIIKFVRIWIVCIIFKDVYNLFNICYICVYVD